MERENNSSRTTAKDLILPLGMVAGIGGLLAGLYYYGKNRPESECYSEATYSGLNQTTNSANSDSESCRICFDTFKTNQKVAFLKCFHKFHTECINTWFSTQKSCPICRIEI